MLTQCFVLSCNQFLSQLKLISWGSLIPPRYLAVGATARSSGREGRGGGRHPGWAGWRVQQYSGGPSARGTAQGDPNNELLGHSAGRSSSLDCPLTSAATGWSGPYSPPQRHFPNKAFWDLREVKKKNSITIQTIHNNRSSSLIL